MKKALLLYLFCLSFSTTHAQGSVQVSEQFTFDSDSEYQKGLAAINAFQYDKAVNRFYECHRNEPNNLEYLSKLAWCYLQTGNYSESKIYFKEILKKDPEHVVALSNLGHLFEKELNYSEAQPYYRQLIEIDSNTWLVVMKNIKSTALSE